MILSVVVQVPLIIHFQQYLFFSKEKPVAIEPTLFPQTGGCYQAFSSMLASTLRD